MATYLLKQYHRGSLDFPAGKLVVQQAVEVSNDDAAIAAAQPLLKELDPNDFVRLEDQTGRVVALWGTHA